MPGSNASSSANNPLSGLASSLNGMPLEISISLHNGSSLPANLQQGGNGRGACESSLPTKLRGSPVPSSLAPRAGLPAAPRSARFILALCPTL